MSNNQATKQRVMLYPGAGDDLSYLHACDDINRYILMDAMPNMKHYKPGTCGYDLQENFVQRIDAIYGKPYETIDNVRYYIYGDVVIEYHYNCDAEMFLMPSEVTDIYLCGYEPSWVSMIPDNINVYKNCNSYFDAMVHGDVFHGDDCRCNEDEEDDSEDE